MIMVRKQSGIPLTPRASLVEFVVGFLGLGSKVLVLLGAGGLAVVRLVFAGDIDRRSILIAAALALSLATTFLADGIAHLRRFSLRLQPSPEPSPTTAAAAPAEPAVTPPGEPYLVVGKFAPSPVMNRNGYDIEEHDAQPYYVNQYRQPFLEYLAVLEGNPV